MSTAAAATSVTEKGDGNKCQTLAEVTFVWIFGT
jgi:hypothetical protein